ncbi:MAG TPA: hypothetical protein VN176_19745 [Verrucomicrobiae bacterium]|nr:hypothetical protein [Verrucomicrobiae bacterium]
MAAGNSCRVCIRALMAGDALQPRNAVPSRPTHDIEEMPVAIVTLLRVTPGCVAVDTARVGHYAIDLLPGGKAFGTALARFPGR